MRSENAEFDYERYRKLLADAVDESKRLELINILIDERAMERLAAQRMSDRVAMTREKVIRVLGPRA